LVHNNLEKIHEGSAKKKQDYAFSMWIDGYCKLAAVFNASLKLYPRK